MFATRFDIGSEHDRRRAAAAKLMYRFYDSIDNKGVQLLDAAVAALEHIGKHFICIYSALSMEALGRDVKAWKWGPSSTCGNIWPNGCPTLGGNPRLLDLCRRGYDREHDGDRGQLPPHNLAAGRALQMACLIE